MAFSGSFVMPQFALRAMTPVPPVEEAAPSRPGEVTFGLGISDQEVTESFDTLFPLAVPKNGLLFINPKLSLSDELDARVSLGIGYRHLFPESNVILGANLFYDSFDSVHDHRINQFGAGIEVLTRWVDFRANYYLPEQDRRSIAKTETVSISRKASESEQALGPRVTSQSLAFQGNNILQNTMGANDTLHTLDLRETETTRIWERYEAGMRGGDAEIGFLIPGLDRYADVRVFGGYYFYENDFGKDVNGFKGRVEVRALPAVTFDAMYYDDKEVIGSNWFYGVRISAPFDLANMSNHRSPFAGFTEAFRPKSQVDEKQLFASRMTENIMRTSRVTTSESKFIQTDVKKEVYEGKTTYVTSTPFSSSTLLTLNGAPITVTHVDSAAVGGTGTFEAPYVTLTLASADPVKRDIVFLHADSVFNNQSITLAAGQQLLGDAANVTHLINSDQGLLPLPHANGTAAPIINNPGGALINVADNTTISGVNLSGAQRGIYAAAGATNVTITNSTISNMTIAGIEIVPSNGTTIDNVTFNNNATDVILNAFNTTLKNLTSNNATNGAFKLSNTTGTTTITNVTVNNAAVFGLQINNPGGTHNITNLDINGGTGSGVEIIGGGGAFAFDSTSSITNTGGVAFKLDGGAANVTYNGTISENNAVPLVSVLAGHTGTATFNGTLTATNGPGLLFDNADGAYNFLGTTTLNGGDAGIDILNGSDGTFAFGAGTAITNPSGQSIFVNGGTASLMFAGTVTDNTGATVEVLNHTTGTISFLAGSTITSTGGTGLQFNNASGTYNFLGTTTLNGGDAGIDILTSNGTFNFAIGTTVTNPTGTGFFLNGGQANVTYQGSISDNTGFALQVINHSVGTLNFNTGTVTSTGGSGVQFVSDSGTYNLASVAVTNSSGAGLEITSSPTGTFAFGSLTVTGTVGSGVQLNTAGTVSILGGSINGTGGNGIFSQNTALTVTGTSIGNNTALNIAGIGIQVINNDGTARLVNLSSNNIRSTGSAIVTTDNGAAGGLTLILDGNTYETLAPGSKALNITGSGVDSTTVRSMNGGTVVGNGNGGGLYFTRVTFDGDGATVGNQQVAAGTWNIGQGTANRVFNDGLHLDGPTGVLGFTTLNIFNNAGTGLFVDTKALGTTFALGNTGGTIDTTNGAAMDIDPLATNLTFASVTSANSGTSGVIVDTLAAGSTLTIGTTTVSNSTGDGIVVRASAGSNINFGTTTVTNAGEDAIDLSQAGNANIIFGTTNINGFGAANAGVNFNGSDATVTFGVTTIQNGGNGTAIDLSNTQNGRVITFATGSSITNVAIGVQLSSSGTTATSANANFTFGDGSGVDANGKNSTISATTTVAAIGLNPALGTYNFQDVNFTGAFLFPASPGALFVSATAVNGVGDGSFANPYSVSDADAITAGGSTFAFLDGNYDFAALNGGAAFSLGSGQAVTGLDNGNVVTFGTVQPANVLGDFGVLGGSASRVVGGTLSITNGTAAGSVFTLFGGNNVTNITVTGEAGAVDPAALFSSDGLAGGFNNGTGITLSGVTIGNLQAGATALAFSNMTGSVQVTGNNINTTAGTLLSVNGGTATYTITKGATGTLTGAAIDIRGTTGGSVAVTDATLNTNGNTAVTLNGNVATTTFTNLAVTRTAGDTAFDIDATVASTGKVTVAGTSSIGSTAGTAFKIGAGGRDIDASALNFTNANTTAANVIVSTGQTGGTISFGSVGITGFNNAAGTAVSLQGTGGTVNFNSGLNITTDLAAGFAATGALTLNVLGATNSITTGGGLALGLTNTVIGTMNFNAIQVDDSLSAGTQGAVALSGTSGGTATFGTISVERSLVDAISLQNVASGTYNFNGQLTVVSVNGAANAIDIAGAATGSTFNFSDVNLSTVPNADAISLANNNGAQVSFTGGQIDRVIAGDAIHSVNTNLTVTGVSIGSNLAFNVGGNGIEVINNDGVARLVTLSNNNIRSTSDAIKTSDGGAAGELSLVLNGNTLTTTGVGSLAMNIAGTALNSTTVNSFDGVTVTANGTGGGILFNRVTFDAVTGGTIQQVTAAAAANIGQGTAAGQRVQGDGLRFDGPTGDLAFADLNIFNNAGTGLFVDTKTSATTFSLGNTGGTIDTTGGPAMNLDPLPVNLTFASVTSTNSATSGVILDTVGGSVTIGTLNVTNAGSHGLLLQNSSANVTLTNITVTTAGGDGIHLSNNTGSFNTAAGGTTTISDVTGDGIDLTGLTANPTVNMLGAVNITDFGGIGVNFTGANVTAAFGVTTINNIANGGAGTAIDLTSTTGNRNITFAAGSAISNVNIGVQIGATSPTAAVATFIFGDGNSGNGLQSSITATTTVAALGLDPVPNSPGVYNFNDVTLTGAVQFNSAPGGAVFVSATAVNGAGNGSFANPFSVSDANAEAGTANFIFLDGTYNFAALGAGGFTLAANQTATGLDNSNSVSFGIVQPNRILGNFGVLGGVVTRANTGNGTLSITNGTAGGDVFSLFGSNSVTNLTITGEAGAFDPLNMIASNGLAGGFNNAGGITITGVTIGNVQAGSSTLAFADMTGNITAQDNTFNGIGGTLVGITGGTGVFNVTRGTGTLTGRGLTISGTTGGSVTVTGATLSTLGNTAVTLNGNAAAVTLTDLAVTRTAGDTAFNIDATTASTATVTINGASTLDSTAGSAFLIGAGARNINAAALSFTNTGTTAANVISSTGQTGGTISFGSVGITGYNNAAGTAVNLQGTVAGTVSFTDLDITTAAGAGLNVGAITFAPGASATVNATNGAGVTMTGTTLGGGGASLTSVSSTNSGTTGISLTNVIGNLDLGTGSISGSTGTAFLVSGTSGTVAYAGSLANTVGQTVSIQSIAGGSVTLSGNLNAGGTGILVQNNTGGTFTFSGTTKTLNTAANTALTLANNGGAAINFINGGLNIDTTTATAVNITGGGTITISGTTNTIDSTSGTTFLVGAGNAAITSNAALTGTTGRLVDIQNHTTNTITLSGNLNSTGTGILVNANTSGTVNFSGTSKILNTGINAAVTLTGNSGATINFTGGGLDIDATSGIGFNATGGGTISVTGAGNSINNTGALATHTATALNVVNTTIGASGITFESIASGASGNAGIILDNTGASGGLTVTGTGTNGSGGTIANKTGGNVTTGNADGTVTISGTTGIGIFLRNTASVSLNYMQLNDFTNYAILGSSVTNFTMTHTTVNGVNGNQANVEDSITFNNLLGSALIDTSNISGGFVDNLRVVNNTGTLNRLTVSNSTFGATTSNNLLAPDSNDSFFFGARGNAVANVTVDTVTFQGAVGDNFQADAVGTSTMDVVFRNNTVNTSLVGPAQGGGGMLISGGGTGSAPTVTFDIENNNLSGALTSEINVSFLGTATGGLFHGSILNNTTGISGVAASGGTSGIEIFSGGPLFTVTISGNTMQQYSQIGLFVHAAQAPINAVMNATITNNIVRQPYDDGLSSLFAGVDFDIGTPTDQITLNLLFSGNNVGGSAGAIGIADVLLGNGPGSTINVSKNGNNTTPVEALIEALNPTGAPTVDASNIQGTINIVVPAPVQ